jgi:basic amino acid/polyamine antiporter, APA family
MPGKTKKIQLLTATAFAVGAMIGGGVFVLTGTALKQTGPAALVSFIAAGAIVLLSALSFAVIASEAPPGKPGYAYVGKVLGSPIWSFLTSWCFYLSGIIAAAFVLNAFGVYINGFIVHAVPVVVWALIGAVVLTLVNLGPASEIGKVETFLVGGKLLVLALLIVFGLARFHTQVLQPFNPHGSSHIFATSAFLFIAFLGFNVITNISGDIENPRRTVPRAILLSMLVVTLVYIGVVIALLAAHIRNYSEASVGIAAQHLIGPIGGVLIVGGALVSTLSSANANILGSSEVMVRLAANKDVPTVFGRMRHGHPYVSVLAGAVLYIVLILSRQTNVVVNLANVTAIVALLIVNVAAARALTSRSHTGLRLPMGGLLPLLGAAGAAVQFAFIPLTSSIIGILLACSGLLAYALRKRYHIPQVHQEIVHAVEDAQGPLSRSLNK